MFPHFPRIGSGSIRQLTSQSRQRSTDTLLKFDCQRQEIFLATSAFRTVALLATVEQAAQMVDDMYGGQVLGIQQLMVRRGVDWFQVVASLFQRLVGFRQDPLACV